MIRKKCTHRPYLYTPVYTVSRVLRLRAVDSVSPFKTPISKISVPFFALSLWTGLAPSVSAFSKSQISTLFSFHCFIFGSFSPIQLFIIRDVLSFLSLSFFIFVYFVCTPCSESFSFTYFFPIFFYQPCPCLAAAFPSPERRTHEYTLGLFIRCFAFCVCVCCVRLCACACECVCVIWLVQCT